MHRYLRTIGFSQYHSDEEVRNLLDSLQARLEDTARVVTKPTGDVVWEIRAELGPGMGILMEGYIDHQGRLVRERYMPFYEIDEITSDVYCSLQRHVDNCVFSGLLDDQRVGISLIFRLMNPGEYLQRRQRCMGTNVRGVQLVAYSTNGKILLPLKKTAKQREMSLVADKAREQLIDAARHGDETAMETLNAEDMNLYSSISKRMLKEDIYSIVDSTFMPQGIECDIYTVIGEILEIDTRKNFLTGEDVWDFLVRTNDIRFHVVTNQIDLQGQPEVGRRFKGTIWMQGRALWDGRTVRENSSEDLR